MPDFEDYAARAAQIALEIERKLIALNVDWHDETAVRGLAREALAHDKGREFQGLHATSPEDLARVGLFGLIAVMLDTMAEGAEDGQHIHGSDAWKALGKALWAEKALLPTDGST